MNNEICDAQHPIAFKLAHTMFQAARDFLYVCPIGSESVKVNIFFYTFR